MWAAAAEAVPWTCGAGCGWEAPKPWVELGLRRLREGAGRPPGVFRFSWAPALDLVAEYVPSRGRRSLGHFLVHEAASTQQFLWGKMLPVSGEVISEQPERGIFAGVKRLEVISAVFRNVEVV